MSNMNPAEVLALIRDPEITEEQVESVCAAVAALIARNAEQAKEIERAKLLIGNAEIKAIEQGRRIAELEAERDALREFARWTIAESAFCGGDIDGGDVQDKAAALGIIQEVQVTEPCRESCACAEFGFPTTCYRFAWTLARAEAGHG